MKVLMEGQIVYMSPRVMSPELVDMKYRVFIDLVRSCWLLKKKSNPWCYC